MSQSIRSQGDYLGFPIGPKNRNLVEDVEIVFSVKLRWILFRGEVENASANQRPGGDLVFRSARKNKNLCLRRGLEDVEILQCFVLFRLVVSEERSKMYQRIRGMAVILFSRSARKHKLRRGHWGLAVKFRSVNSAQWFQRRSRKCEKLMTDGRTMRDHNSEYEPSAQVL